MPAQGVHLRRVRAPLPHPGRRSAERTRAHVPGVRQHRPVHRHESTPAPVIVMRAIGSPPRPATGGARATAKLPESRGQRDDSAEVGGRVWYPRRMLKAVTFDFWNTLFVDVHGQERERLRAEVLRDELETLGRAVPQTTLDDALRAGFDFFDRVWVAEHRTPSCAELVDSILATLGARLAGGRSRAPRAALRAAATRPAAGAHAGGRVHAAAAGRALPAGGDLRHRLLAGERAARAAGASTACWPTSSTSTSPTSTA